MASTPIIGIIGPSGAGKSTLAKTLTRQYHAGHFEADAVVGALYAQGSEAIPAIAQALPEIVVDGAVDKARTRAAIADPAKRTLLLATLVPFLQQRLDAFVAQHAGRPILLDAPLLLDTPLAARCDAMILVDAPAELRRQRVTARALERDPQVDVAAVHAVFDIAEQGIGSPAALTARAGALGFGTDKPLLTVDPLREATLRPLAALLQPDLRRAK